MPKVLQTIFNINLKLLKLQFKVALHKLLIKHTQFAVGAFLKVSN